MLHTKETVNLQANTNINLCGSYVKRGEIPRENDKDRAAIMYIHFL